MNGYTASQMREIREGFNTLDRDRSGKLSIGEIKFFLKATNVTDNEQEIKRIVKEMDIDQDGEISFDEFVQVMSNNKKYSLIQIKKAFESLNEVREMFNVIDRDKSGRVSFKEMRFFFRVSDKGISDEKIEELFKKMDASNDGEISFEEFLTFYIK